MNFECLAIHVPAIVNAIVIDVIGNGNESGNVNVNVCFDVDHDGGVEKNDDRSYGNGSDAHQVCGHIVID